MIYDPEVAFHELERASEEYCEALYKAHLLEKSGEALLGNLMQRCRNMGTPATMCKDIAKTDPQWKTHIEGEAEAIRLKNRTLQRYRNLTALMEGRRTQEVTRRNLT